MNRFLAGAISAALLLAAGVFLWRAFASEPSPLPPAPVRAMAQPASQDMAATAPDLNWTPPPAAAEQTREERRFARADRDRSGAVSRNEYLAGRHRAFARLDVNGDGRLTFDEYALKGAEKFAKADGDGSGQLSAKEFATTRAVRKAQPNMRKGSDCVTTAASPAAEGQED